MNKKNANSKNAFVTIVGRANAGKSSLLNALVGEKIAAVSDKPQTTRTKITGVLTKGETQFVFMDTPGMHKAKNKLSEHMLNAVNESVAGVDLIILMADCTKKISENERELVKGFKTGKTKVILVLNKIDLLENKEDQFVYNSQIFFRQRTSFQQLRTLQIGGFYSLLTAPFRYLSMIAR